MPANYLSLLTPIPLYDDLLFVLGMYILFNIYYSILVALVEFYFFLILFIVAASLLHGKKCNKIAAIINKMSLLAAFLVILKSSRAVMLVF